MKNQRSVMIVGNFLSSHARARGICEDLAEHLKELGWGVITTSNKLGRVARMLDMVKIVWSHRNQYELATIDTYSGPSFLWAEVVGFVLRTLKKPYILTLHGGNLPNFAQRWPGRVTRFLKSATVVTVPSRYLLEQMKSYRPDLMLIPNPIDLARYRFRCRTEPSPVLMWLRTFNYIYNPSLAVQAAASLISKYPNFHLFMAGSDNGDGNLQKAKQLADSLHISSFIEFESSIPKKDIPAWLQKGDIFINTTNIDNTPVSVLEAMACGLCVVSTNVGGIPYLLEDGIDALLVAPNDPVEMSSAVDRILTEPGLSARLSKNAREKTERFDWTVILPRWEELLNDSTVNE